jgi:exodeoxyribonuclease VII large subunit
VPNRFPPPGEPLSVGQAILFLNTVLGDFALQIEGEVAGFTVNQGKFVFFDIKDEEQEARLSCFMMAYQLTVPLQDGMKVRVDGAPRLHQKSGKFSITAQRVQPIGEGSLKRAFLLLQQKLEAEGLFVAGRKRALPKYPTRVGVISSRDAAGYGDFMRLAQERLPGVTFVFAHCAVQGDGAVESLVAALDHLNECAELDAVVLIRGGGSMEDLHAFNSEPLARAIARSKAPVVVGVGHERDVTIADYCADVRAATPSNAAQLLLPTKEEVLAAVQQTTAQMARVISSHIGRLGSQLEEYRRNRYQGALRMIQLQESQLQNRVELISAYAPQRILERGYTITTDKAGRVVRTVQAAPVGAALTTRLSDGCIKSTVV